MRRLTGLMFVGVVGLLGAAALAETKVEVKNVHLCCGACVSGVTKALKGVEGVKGVCDRDAKTVTLTAVDLAAARKAVDALAAAGYHGETDIAELAVKEDSGAPKGKVTTLKISGVHNCCGACTKAIQGALKKVNGVAGDTAKAKQSSFEVTGDFEAAELVRALNQAGFHVKVSK